MPESTMDIGRLYEAITVLNELIEAIEKLPANEAENGWTDHGACPGKEQSRVGSCSTTPVVPVFQDALWTTAMEGGIPSPEASAEPAELLKWLANNPEKDQGS
jgi:hypothetical protein